MSLLLFFLLFISVQAQERFFNYLSGWVNNYSTEVEDGYLVFGLGTGAGIFDHLHQINQIDLQGELIDEYIYEVDSVKATSTYLTSQRSLRIGDDV